MTLPFAEAVDGVTVPLRLTSEQPCPTCHGTGGRDGALPHSCPTCHGTGQTSRNQGGFAFAEPCRECRGRGLVVDDPCPDCHGSGRAMGTRTITVRIPAGVKDGQRIRLKGKGAPGERGGPPGDLYVIVHVAPHPLFGRKGDNLTLTVPVTFAEAALGARDQGADPRRAAGDAADPGGHGQRPHASGSAARACPASGDGTKGDLLVTVEVAVPTTLSAEARQAVEALRDATTGDDPRADLLAAPRQRRPDDAVHRRP